MRNLLKSDFYKLKESKAFWILSAVAVAVSIITILAIRFNKSAADAVSANTSASGVWALVNCLPPIALLMGILVSIFLTSEFTNGPMKNILSRGSKRISVYISKFITCGCACVFMMLICWIACLALGTIFWGFNPNGAASAAGLIAYLLLMLLLMLAYTAIFTFIAMTIRSNGGTVAINVVVAVMMTTVIGLIGRIVGGSVDLSKYWLDGSISALTYTSAASDNVRALIVALVWGAVAIAGGMLLFQKRDVK